MGDPEKRCVICGRRDEPGHSCMDGERRFPPGWFGDGWEYVFGVDRPVNRDVHVLKVLRWQGEGDELEEEYLSTEGWRPYEPAEVLSDLIEMPGLRHHSEQQIQHRVIDAMVHSMGVERSVPE